MSAPFKVPAETGSDIDARGSSRSPDWPVLSAADLDEWHDEPMEWLVQDIIPKGSIGFVGAAPKIGKSLLLADLCVHLSRANFDTDGVFWLDRFHCKPATVLYIAREDPARRIKPRLQEIVAGKGWGDLPLLGLYFVVRPRFDLTNAAHRDWLCQQIKEVDADVVVLDVLNRMIPGIDENSAKDMASVVDILEDLNRDLNVTLIVVDHTRKPANGENLYAAPNPHDLRGSGAKYGCAEFVISLNRTRDPRRLQIYAESKDADEMRFVLDVSPIGSSQPKFGFGGWQEDVAKDRKALGVGNREKVLAAVGTDTWIGKKEIRAMTGLANTTVGEHLRALVESKRIEQRGANKTTEYRRLKG